MAGISASPGDVVIDELTITPKIGNPVNIKNQVLMMDIFESIFSPSLYAEFFLYDPIDMINTLPVRGEEIIDLSYHLPGGQTSTWQFAVVQIAHSYPGNQDKAKFYTLKCFTVDHFVNAKQKFSKKYTDNSSTVIQSILKNQLGSAKNLISEPTKGIQDILIAKMFPFQAIDLVRRRSVSSSFLSSSYCFFENQKGYNFQTIEGMMSKNSKNIGNKVFTYDASVLQNARDVGFRNILAYRHLQHGNSWQMINAGVFNNRVTKFDFFTKTKFTVDYKNTEKQGNFKWSDGTSFPWNSPQFEGENNDTTPQFFFVPADSSRPENYISEAIGPQLAYTAQMAQNITQISVYGDNSIDVGDVITATLPENTGFTKKVEEAKLVTGNFLVSKVRHTITLQQNLYYKMSLELMKGRIMTNV